MNLGGSGGIWEASQAEEERQKHESAKQQGVLGEGILTQGGSGGLPDVGEELGLEARANCGRLLHVYGGAISFRILLPSF